MRKILITLSVIVFFLATCKQLPSDKEADSGMKIVDMSDFYVYTDDESFKNIVENGRNCYTMKVLNEKLAKDPELEKKMYYIEYFTRTAIALNDTNVTNKNYPGANIPSIFRGPINIPVVVNILENFNGQISQSQIQSQIAVLNEDYNNTNPHTSGIPAEFEDVVANCNITFTLTAVNRKTTSVTSWGTNDAMKYTSLGGIDVTDPEHTLNIWVCEIGEGVLGYAQFPGGDPATDGVVIGTNYFGITSGYYGNGRTATHEIGHWLNLRHIWGDGRCSRDDFVADTPASDRANYGCPDYPTVHCQTNDMTMNYMDYVYDECMYMFTKGQNDRIRAIFAPGGARESFISH